MIQQIVVYAVVVGTALGVVGLCLERLATLQRLPRRFAWIAAMLLSILLPLVMILRAEPAGAPLSVPLTIPALLAAPAARSNQGEPIVANAPAPRGAGSSVSSTPQSEARQPSPSQKWHLPQLRDRNLLVAWAIASLLSGLYLLGANQRLRRRISGWQRATLLGHPVLVSETTGPALVGIFRPRMVIPRWLLDEPVATQALILEHEQQHIAAHDPLLIRAGVVLLAALPWNLPLWWQWRRMRQAIELDCDARVLRTGAEPETYGEVLLAISGRATRMPSGVVAMSEPVSALERRIHNLLPDPVRHAAWQATGAIVLLAAGVTAAIAMNAPDIPGWASPRGAVALSVPATMKPLLGVPAAIEATPPVAATSVPVLAMAAAAAPPATSDPIATPATDMSPRDLVLRAAVQRYPQLINGPALPGFYTVVIVLRPDGTVQESSLRPNLREADVSSPAAFGSDAMAGVVELVLNRRMGRTTDDPVIELSMNRAFDKVEEGPQVAKILEGEQIADLGTASSNIEVRWQVLPADRPWSAPIRTAMAAAPQQKKEANVPALETTYFQIRYATARDLASFVRSAPGIGLLSDQGSIAVDERTNSLLVRDTAPNIATIRQLVTTLDVPVQTIAFTAVFALVDSDLLRELTAGKVPSGSWSPVTDLGPDQDVLAALTAAQQAQRAEIVSAPKFIAANRSQASIQQSAGMPFDQGGAAPGLRGKDMNITLRVTPTVVPDNRVAMDIDIELTMRSEKVVVVTGGTPVPSIDTRQVKNQVTVESGRTVMLDVWEGRVAIGAGTGPLRRLVAFVTPKLMAEVPARQAGAP